MKNAPKLLYIEDFTQKQFPEIAIFGQWVLVGCQNIAGFLNFFTFLSDFVAKFG
jgi:hypothetical protein